MISEYVNIYRFVEEGNRTMLEAVVEAAEAMKSIAEVFSASFGSKRCGKRAIQAEIKLHIGRGRS